METNGVTTKRVPFKRSDDAKPDDLVTIHVTRSLRDIIEAERDRLDPPVDSFGRKRRQLGVDKFATTLLLRGLQWTKEKPDWNDPLSFD